MCKGYSTQTVKGKGFCKSVPLLWHWVRFTSSYYKQCYALLLNQYLYLALYPCKHNIWLLAHSPGHPTYVNSTASSSCFAKQKPCWTKSSSSKKRWLTQNEAWRTQNEDDILLLQLWQKNKCSIGWHARFVFKAGKKSGIYIHPTIYVIYM